MIGKQKHVREILEWDRRKKSLWRMKERPGESFQLSFLASCPPSAGFGCLLPLGLQAAVSGRRRAHTSWLHPHPLSILILVGNLPSFSIRWAAPLFYGGHNYDLGK